MILETVLLRRFFFSRVVGSYLFALMVTYLICLYFSVPLNSWYLGSLRMAMTVLLTCAIPYFFPKFFTPKHPNLNS